MIRLPVCPGLARSQPLLGAVMNDRFNDTSLNGTRFNGISPPDTCRISLQEPQEVQYWTSRLGISLNQLRQAIDEVGPSPAHIEAWLKYQAQIIA